MKNKLISKLQVNLIDVIGGWTDSDTFIREHIKEQLTEKQLQEIENIIKNFIYELEHYTYNNSKKDDDYLANITKYCSHDIANVVYPSNIDPVFTDVFKSFGIK